MQHNAASDCGKRSSAKNPVLCSVFGPAPTNPYPAHSGHLPISIIRWELTECWRDQVGSEVPYTTFYKDRLKMVARSKKAITTAEWCCAQIQEISKSLAETTKRALESQRTLSTGPLEDKADLDHFHTFRRLYLGLGMHHSCTGLHTFFSHAPKVV